MFKVEICTPGARVVTTGSALSCLKAITETTKSLQQGQHYAVRLWKDDVELSQPILNLCKLANQ